MCVNLNKLLFLPRCCKIPDLPPYEKMEWSNDKLFAVEKKVFSRTTWLRASVFVHMVTESVLCPNHISLQSLDKLGETGHSVQSL